MDHQEQYQNYLAQAMVALKGPVRLSAGRSSEESRAARYSLDGRRQTDPCSSFVLSVCDMLGGSMQAAQQFAAAVEMSLLFAHSR